MPRDAVSRRANVGTVGKIGLISGLVAGAALRLVEALPSASGRYSCRATNDDMTHEAEAVVTVNGGSQASAAIIVFGRPIGGVPLLNPSILYCP